MATAKMISVTIPHLLHRKAEERSLVGITKQNLQLPAANGFAIVSQRVTATTVTSHAELVIVVSAMPFIQDCS